MDAAGDPVVTAIDGATSDWTVSGDAMRWTPDAPREGPSGLEAAVGPGAGIGLDLEPVRRLVTDAIASLGAIAGDVVAELRHLALGPSDDEGRG